ncbi:centrosomal protein 20-like, partial [Pectinophora gossypiella]|uniref:centrosomal protein 20-like n=1 Tax=Pectinophora gossypiella TaxID=13191 RepID=UPI00214E9788
MTTKNMTTEKDLLNAIKDLLKRSGHLNKFQAEVQANITQLLKSRNTMTAGTKKTAPPPPPEEVLLINELVREYLEWHGYLYTSSVMMSEAAMPDEKKARGDLCAAIGVKDDEKSSALPLLSNIVAAYQNHELNH